MVPFVARWMMFLLMMFLCFVSHQIIKYKFGTAAILSTLFGFWFYNFYALKSKVSQRWFQPGLKFLRR